MIGELEPFFPPDPNETTMSTFGKCADGVNEHSWVSSGSLSSEVDPKIRDVWATVFRESTSFSSIERVDWDYSNPVNDVLAPYLSSLIELSEVSLMIDVMNLLGISWNSMIGSPEILPDLDRLEMLDDGLFGILWDVKNFSERDPVRKVVKTVRTPFVPGRVGCP